MPLARVILVATIGFTYALAAASQTWERSNGPEGGVVLALAVLDGNIFAGTELGVYRSENGGLSWSLTDPRLNDIVTSLAVSGSTLFAGTYMSGVFRSDDSGQTWTASSNGLFEKSVWSLAVSGERLFAGTLSKVFYSDDLGSSWIEASAGLQGIYVRSFAFQSGSAFAALSSAAFPPPQPPGGGVYKSTDGGSTWVSASQGLGSFVSVRSLLSAGDALLAGTEDGLFRSRDGAMSWVASGLQGRFVTALFDTGNELFAGTGGIGAAGVFQSTNGGLTWSQTGLQGIEVDTFAVSNGRLFAGTPLGVFVSEDGGFTWKLEKSGMFNTNVTSLFSALGSIFAIVHNGLARDVLVLSADGGQTWSESGEGLPDRLEGPGVAQDNAIFLGTSGGIYKSVDKGHTWVPSNSDLPLLDANPLGASDTVLFAGSDFGLFRSVDSGSSWIRGQAGIPDYDLVHSIVFANGAVYAGGFFGVYKSNDAGGFWTRTSLPTGADVVSAPSGELYAVVTDSQTFRSQDGGASWTPMSSTSRSPVRILVPVGRSLFAATARSDFGDDGIYRSLDDGASWQLVNQGLARTSILALIASGTELFAAVDGYGVQRLTLRAPLDRLPAHPKRTHVLPQR